MDAAVVKLNALTNAVGATAQHHDLFIGSGFSFTFSIAHAKGVAMTFVARIHVSGVGRELGGTGVHALVDRADVQFVAARAHDVLGGFQQLGQAAVREPFFLQRTQFFRRDGRQSGGFQLQLNLDDLFDLHQEPGVDLGQGKHLVHAQAHGESITHVPNALRSRLAQLLFQHFAVLGLFVHAVHANFQAAQGFLERLLEGTAHRHHLPHRFHLGGQAAIGRGEFLKRKTWDLGDHVIDRGLKRCGCGTARDLVAQFVQRVAHRQFGSDFGDRKARGFGSQCRRTRDARIHLDHNHAAIDRVDGELHVRASSIYTDFTQNRQGGVAQNLVFLVSQGLSGCHRNRVPGVHTHGVQVFDGADDDAVVRFVAHHFHLVLFPTQERLFNQQLVGGRSFQAALANGLKLFRVVGDAAARAAQREARANDGGKAQGLLHFPSFFHAVGNTGARRTQTNFGHGVFELQTVFGFVDGFRRGANQLDLVFFEHAVVPQIQCAVQCGLAAHGGQDRVGTLFGNDLLDRLPSDGFDVGHVGRGRIGHDRCRVAVDQDDFVTLFTQSLAGLHARVVELAGLTDDDRAGANDENAFKVGALWHIISPPSS